MGFGWLLIGYFVSTLMTINQAGNLLRCAGLCIMLGACRKLRSYQGSFGIMSLALCLSLVPSLWLAVGDIGDFLYQNLIFETPLLGERMRTALGYAKQITDFLLGASMLYAIRAIAKDTEVKKISDGSVRNFVFLCMYQVVVGVSYLFMNTQSTAVMATLTVAMWLLYFAVIFLDLVLIFSCYRWICDEDDVEMEQRPSRFAFVNEYRRQKEERQEEKRQRRQERIQRREGRKS